MINTHEFVQKLFHTKDKVASVILYNDSMMKLLTSMCCDRNIRSVLGVDRTFNLGEVYVTATAFKCQSLISKKTSEAPIFFGPMLLHGSSTFFIYRDFFSQIAALLSTTQQAKLIIGSDDEKALTSAIRHAMPEATQILCTRHLKSNAQDYLKNKVGVSKRERGLIMDQLFDCNGAAAANDSIDFAIRVDTAKELCMEIENGDRFIKYLDTRLAPLLRNGVFEPNVKCGMGFNWTNNNMESMNHVLKTVVDWKPRPLPELIFKICDKVSLQQKEFRRALVGMGNYMLHEEHEHYRVSDGNWKAMTSGQKHKLVDDFIADKRKKKTN